MIIREYEKDEVTVDKVPLMLMGGIVLISLVLTALVQFGFFEKTAIPDKARAEAGIKPAAMQTLRFFDEEDGTVRVENGPRTEVLGRFGPGEGGFIRASVRSLVHQRRIRGEGPEVPFELTEWENGNITLNDPVTGKSVEVASFGPDNRAIFANMLPAKESR
ncbi:photosynthetic complex assembly protein PuhC [Erythrobacter dokdonensis]|jgi:putative photosynthetic complex assembly protein|uniref:Putative photosynthetic complex assembly protein n=1 Tax=Erythrobacter dokdonensis DSW-74 TaxID=1300349 RepID=A0A1A7BD47_9SPHN|nr:photosynthetic complex assembly protein PuhC [Erythrobacter dokdonensis]MEE4317602.1 photosynthetic complex assembly protein PuhC [Erythrobacter sp.]OBV10414.1 putative photosynthetic complex assembly protein [Erythrobacter dokdonensis DSW-74]